MLTHHFAHRNTFDWQFESIFNKEPFPLLVHPPKHVRSGCHAGDLHLDFALRKLAKMHVEKNF